MTNAIINSSANEINNMGKISFANANNKTIHDVGRDQLSRGI